MILYLTVLALAIVGALLSLLGMFLGNADLGIPVLRFGAKLGLWAGGIYIWQGLVEYLWRKYRERKDPHPTSRKVSQTAARHMGAKGPRWEIPEAWDTRLSFVCSRTIRGDRAEGAGR